METKNEKQRTTVPEDKVFLRTIKDVIKVEREEYLHKRRKNLNIPVEQDNTAAIGNLTGICISGGGVRSATLGLGFMQALMKKNIFKYFDYMCTVSGGGYIASCLTSLMSCEDEYIDKARKERRDNQTFNTKEIGLDNDNSPFTGFGMRSIKVENESEESTKGEATPNLQDPYQPTLNVRNQLHHLRTHGEYLTPDKSIFSWDVQRAVGAFATGAIMGNLQLLLFVTVIVAYHHWFYLYMSNGRFFTYVKNPEQSSIVAKGANDAAINYSTIDVLKVEATTKSLLAQLGDWYTHKFSKLCASIVEQLMVNNGLTTIFFASGLLLALLFVGLGWRRARQIAQKELLEQNEPNSPDVTKRLDGRRAGYDIQRQYSRDFQALFLSLIVVVGPLLAYAYVFYEHFHRQEILDDKHYMLMFGLPFCFSLGVFFCTTFLIPTLFLNRIERVAGRYYRSFYTGLQGATIYALVIAVLFPAVMLTIFSTAITLNFLFSLIPVLLTYYIAAQRFGGDASKSFLGTITSKLSQPLLAFSIFLLICMVSSACSEFLKFIFDYENSTNLASLYWKPLWVFAGAMLLFLLLGTVVNINELSLHQFYRDRLSEAYLRTNARVARPSNLPMQEQGHPVVNLRNHENLRLCDIGNDRHITPYHIILAAVNMIGSDDLVKRSQKADHFIFSKFYVGSRSTGYMRTELYNRGSLKLSQAMTISAAAVASGMGFLSSFAQDFYLSLFNVKTGYWLYNPFHDYKRYKSKKQSWLQKRNVRFWYKYNIRELFGLMHATTPLVYVSDGNHSGDNLGLFPLLQRKCRLILVCDFEEDGKYDFSSFNNAVRMGYVHYNTTIDIDIHELRPHKDDQGNKFSQKSVVLGKIKYGDGSTGTLIYAKSSVSRNKKDDLPIGIASYLRVHPDFPHQSTADQYFEDAQFEAYRQLGEHIGEMAVDKLSSSFHSLALMEK